MVHIKPAELLLPVKGLSKPTEKMLAHITEYVSFSSDASSIEIQYHFRHSIGGSKIRTERFKGLMSYTEAFSFVSEFYTDKTKLNIASESFASGNLSSVANHDTDLR